MSRRKLKKNSTNGEKVVLVDGSWTPLVDDNGHSRSHSLESSNGQTLTPVGQTLTPVIDQCDVCPAKCCYQKVTLSLPDAIEFCQTLGIPFLSALRFSPDPDGQSSSFLLDHDSRLNPECQPDEWPGKADITLPRLDNDGCYFLVDIGGYKRCGVYAARPSTCRTYPMSYETRDETTVVASKARVSCPAPLAVDATMEEEFKDAVISARRKWLIHQQVIEEWEAFEPEDGRTAENFLLFAIPRAAQLSGLPFHKVIFPRQLS